MSCPSNRCALRRFDGHGTKYKPSNTAAAAEAQAALSRMMAERDLQDAGVFTRPTTTVQPIQQKPTPIEKEVKADPKATYYSLSS